MSDTHLTEFFSALERSLASDTFVKLTLGKYRGDEAGLKNIYIRRVKIKGSDQLSFLHRYQTKDLVKNHQPSSGLARLRELLGAQFLSAHLFTTEGDLQLEFNKRLKTRLISHAPAFSTPPPPAHDQKKRRHVQAEGNAYLRLLGVTDERGQVRAGAGDKFRQIDKFVEIVGDLLASSPVAGNREISIVDMGSGKGYLTFAVHDYFTNSLGIAASTTGVEAREELVTLCNHIAREVGFGGLRFQTGLIKEITLDKVDILIALHACDTATDDALYKGIQAGAAIIITAPCCHKQIRPQIRPPAIVQSMLRHGIHLERQSEMVTDSLRALLLEAAGYATKVFEFISTEHTRKNTMIVGVRRARMADSSDVRRQIEELKNFYGIREHHLEQLLCEQVPLSE